MPVGPLSMLIQGALAMAVSALTRSTCLGVLAVFVPFAGWTMYFYASYPVWFNLWAMSVDFLVLVPFALAGAVHSFFWEAHPLLDGNVMSKTARKLNRYILQERLGAEIKASRTFVNDLLVAVVWRSIVFLALLIGAHVPMELNWANSNLLIAWGIEMAGVAVAWTMFYLLYEYLGTDKERAELKTLFGRERELVPFTLFLCLANLILVTGFFLVRKFAVAGWWEDGGWYITAAGAGAVLVGLLFLIGQCVPLRKHAIKHRSKVELAV